MKDLFSVCVLEEDLFHIISNDSGFNGLVNHLKKIGRNCKKVSTKAIPPAQDTESALGECASIVLAQET
jgi:hypothetical protein